MAKRTDFTESDDESLVKYIARKNPETSGRLGNNLYILLEESADQRPWAKRHSWQSWRERYKKNQDWFNYKIKKHQKKLGVGGTSKGEVQTTRKKPEPNSTVTGDSKPTMDRGKSGSNVEKLAQARAQANKPEKEKPKDDRARKTQGSNVEKLAQAQVQADKPEKEKPNNDQASKTQGSDVGKLVQAQVQVPADKPEKEKPKDDRARKTQGSNVEKLAQAQVQVQADKPEKEKPKDDRARKTQGSNVEKLAQAQGQADKPEKEKHNKRISSIPPASSSETEADELYRELFGISQFSEDNEDEPMDTHEKPLAPSSSNVNQNKIYPSIESVPQPGTVHKEVHIPTPVDAVVKIEASPTLSPTQEPVHKSELSSGPKSITTSTTDARQPLQQPHDKPKKKILPRDDDSNFFATPSPSSSPLATNPFAGGRLPIIHEGPYRSYLKRTRATSENVTNDESWPPKRRKKAVEDIDMISPKVEKSGTGDARGRVETKGAIIPVTFSATGNTNGLARHRPPTPVNAVASSSKVLLPNPPQKHTKPSNLLKVICAKGTPLSDTSPFLANSFVQTATNNGPESVLTDAAPPPKAMNSSFAVDNRKHDERVASSSSRPSKPIHRLIITPNTGTATHQLARISPVDTDADDPFIVSKSIDKTGATSTRNFIPHDKPRRIDLRPSLNKNSIRRSSTFSTRTSTSSTSRQSVTSFLLPEDQEMVNQVGFSEIMAVIAKHYGFDVDVAMNAFFATKSIEKTKTVLQHAKEVANSATSVLLAELVNKNDIDSYDDEGPRSMRRGHSSSSGKDQSKSPGRQKARRSSGRPSLNINIKPQLFDEVIEQNSLSDYSPPRISRAGQFMRLVKQGRRKEAVDRERRRASGVPVAQTQIQTPDENRHRQSLSLVPNSSPTPNVGQEELMVIDSDDDDKDDADNDDGDADNNDVDVHNADDDDFQPPVTTPHEDTVQHQPPGDVSLPIDHHRIFIKRMSKGQSTLNEDEDDPAVVKLAQEHRDLVMNVTAENADALRSFEQKNNPDLLRLWSLDWAKQSIANM